MRLQHRLVIPFVVIVLAATTAAALIALSVTSRALEARMRTQLVSAAGIVSRGDLALNPAIIQNLRDVIGADIITFDAGQEVLASTVAPDASRLLDAARAAVTAGASEEPALSSEAAVVSGACEMPCLIAYQRLDGRPDAVVAIVADTSELAEATRAVTRGIVLGAAVTALIMMVVGQFVMRRVTAPLQRLVQFVRALNPQDTSRRAPVADDEIGELAEAFNGLLDRAQQSQEALVRSEKLAVAGLVAARVAHDVRNPLSSIKMQTQLLQVRGDRDPEDQATLQSILQDINQVESVVRDLVEAARPGDLNRQPTAILPVITEALQQLAPQFAHRKIQVRTEFDADLPRMLLDVSRFRHALLNVLVNAAEAITAGGEITVSCRRLASNAVIEVCDDGAGVEPSVADRIFDPFVSTKREGVGLGLVNAKAVVEGHGGEIRLEPRFPRGTCARITMPCEHG